MEKVKNKVNEVKENVKEVVKEVKEAKEKHSNVEMFAKVSAQLNGDLKKEFDAYVETYKGRMSKAYEKRAKKVKEENAKLKENVLSLIDKAGKTLIEIKDAYEKKFNEGISVQKISSLFRGDNNKTINKGVKLVGEKTVKIYSLA